MIGCPSSLTRRVSRWVSVAVVAAAVTLASGCSGGGGTPQPETEIHLKKLAGLYMKYVQTHQGRGPKSEAEFKEFGKAQNTPDLDSMFVSPRDNQPYTIIYNLSVIPQTGAGPGGPGGPPGGKGPPGGPGSKGGTPIKPPPGAGRPRIMAHEKVGVGGKRYIADLGGRVAEISEEEFNSLMGS
jgi:hypothetical protein